MNPNQNDTPGHDGCSEKTGCRETLRAGDWSDFSISETIEILEFYANPETYRSPSKGFAMHYDRLKSPIENDKGKKAQDLLKKHLHEIK